MGRGEGGVSYSNDSASIEMYERKLIGFTRTYRLMHLDFFFVGACDFFWIWVVRCFNMKATQDYVHEARENAFQMKNASVW